MAKKIISLVLACLMLSLTLLGCKTTEENEEPATEVFISAEEIANYTLIRPENADSDSVSAATKLLVELKQRFGNKITLSTDYAKTEADIPTDTKEILIGGTNRAESIGVRYLDYEIAYRNNRVVINGGNAKMLDDAVTYFITNCVSDEGITVPVEYATTNVYPMENLTANGELLKNFSVKEIQGSVDDTLRAFLGERVGIYSKSRTGNEIILKTDSKYGITEIDIYMDGNNLIIANSSHIGDASLAVEYFMEQLKSVNSDSVTLVGNISMIIDGYKAATSAEVAALRAQTDAKIESIRNTPNMTIPAEATVYYVSNNGNDRANGLTPETAWATLEKVNYSGLPSGSYVCFERGGIWRGTIKAQTGVTYTAYGTGDKPALYGSLENGADPTKWKKAKGTENIWYYEGSQEWADVGTLVFNEGEAGCAIKAIREWRNDGNIYNWTTGHIFDNTYKDLNTDLHFYHDRESISSPKYLYLYSEENPGNRFESIEFNVGKSLIGVDSDVNGVTIDNLCIKYTGAHGVGAGTVKGLTVQNCEFGWIGGSNQGIIQERNFETRFGNAVEIYGGCEDYTVQNNYIYQVYDSGITHQWSNVTQAEKDSGEKRVFNHTNVSYLHNVLDYCGFPIEYFVSVVPEGNESTMTNLLMEGNHMWYSGYGFSEQRPPADRTWGASIKGHAGEPSNRANGYVIKDNIFAYRKDRFVSIISSLTNPDGSDSMPTLINNIFVEEYGVKFGRIKQADEGTEYREDVMYDFNVLAYIEER
ncbi:MAG: hypothetical protein J6U86_06680, partial [Clostridia bacterium]|nr:hypothetical protein [Clostridia bacterium]